METNSSAVATRRFPGRLYAWLGLGAAVVGPVLYTIQVSAKLLTAPWYAPILATMGLEDRIGDEHDNRRFLGAAV